MHDFSKPSNNQNSCYIISDKIHQDFERCSHDFSPFFVAKKPTTLLILYFKVVKNYQLIGCQSIIISYLLCICKCHACHWASDAVALKRPKKTFVKVMMYFDASMLAIEPSMVGVLAALVVEVFLVLDLKSLDWCNCALVTALFADEGHLLILVAFVAAAAEVAHLEHQSRLIQEILDPSLHFLPMAVSNCNTVCPLRQRQLNCRLLLLRFWNAHTFLRRLRTQRKAHGVTRGDAPLINTAEQTGKS